MKKQLIVMAGLTAMFAACTNEDVLENYEAGQALKSEGITFSIAGVESRGDFKLNDASGIFEANWNAEVDYINVAHVGVKKAGSPVTTWSDHNNVAVYKATKTAAKGEFTSRDENNLLTFYSNSNGPVKASFRAYRGGEISSLTYTAKSGNTPAKMILATEVLDEQTQTSATKAPFNNFLMVADPMNEICNLDYAVGESLPLKFERVFAGLAIKTTGYNETVYGKLISVDVEMDKSNIVGKANVEVLAKKDDKWAYEVINPGHNVTLYMDSDATAEGNQAIKWSDNAYAFIQILPVTREKAEDYTVTLHFENGSIEFEKSSSKSWAANGWYTLNLDLTATGDYLVSGEKLIVIKKMPKATTELVSTVKNVIANVALSADELKELNKLTAVETLTLANDAASLGANLANINKLENLKSLTLTAATTAPAISKAWTKLTTLTCKAATEIPAEAYYNNDVITKYVFPVVETIGEDAFIGTKVTMMGVGRAESEELVIGTYKKENNVETITSALTTVGEGAFDGLALTSIEAPALSTFEGNPFGTTCSLTHINMPAMNWNNTDITARFLAIMSNANLKVIDLTGTTAIGGSNISLANKANLEKVILAEGAEIGSSAFTTTKTSVIEFVNLNKIATVGDGAFEGVKFHNNNKNINLDVTTIGKKAFKNTNIVSFDFTGVTTIGEAAFESATELLMANVPSVVTVEKNTFKNCTKLSYVMFGAATTVKADALVGLSENANIIFTEVVTIDGLPFGTMTTGGDGSEAKKAITGTFKYTLDVNDAQTGVKDNTLTWVSGGKYYTATFNSVL